MPVQAALFQLVQVVYWLALSAWFGGVLSIAVAALIIVRTVQESDPVLPNILSVNLESEHATLLAGTIVGKLLSVLVRAELVFAGAMLLALVGQWFLIDLSDSWNLICAYLRSAMFLAAAGLVIYDWRVAWPRIWKYRQDYIDHADEPEIANPARDHFVRYQRESVTLLSILFFLLLGIVALSSGITPGAARDHSTVRRVQADAKVPGNFQNDPAADRAG